MHYNDMTVDNFWHTEANYEAIRAGLMLDHVWKVTDVDIKPNQFIGTFDSENPDSKIVCLKEPADIKELDKGTVTIRIERTKQKTYSCPLCGLQCKAHDHEERTYRHTDFMGLKCFLQVRIPKLHCPNCKFPQLRFPAAPEGASYTKMMGLEILKTAYELTQMGTSRMLGIGVKIVKNVLHKHFQEMMADLDLSNVTEVYVDETQFGHGQNYITVFSDQMKRIIFVIVGHSAETIAVFKEWLIEHGGSPDRIRAVSADMSKAYESGIMEHFPKADIVFDRFHLVKCLNEALDKIRKRTIRALPKEARDELGKIKYTVLYREKNHSEKHEERMMNIRIYNPELALAFDQKEEFCGVLEADTKEQAMVLFNIWYKDVMLHGTEEMKKKAELFELKIDRIMCWFKHKITNGYAEGLNSMIQKTKNAAFGFRNVQNFIDLLYFRYGRLPVRV